MNYQNDIYEYYKIRDQNHQYERDWGYVNPVAAAYWRLRDELVFENVLTHFDPLAQPLKVLEIGVGNGHELSKFSLLGIPQTNLTGIDLLQERLDRAKFIYPNINFVQQDALKLDFPDNTFDIVCQFTCAMHLPSKELQKIFCKEMERVLCPKGIIIWWDIAPLTWRVILLRRLCLCLFGKISFREIISAIKQSTLEALVSSIRKDTLNQDKNFYTLPISSEDITSMFPDLQITVFRAGLDFPIWDLVRKCSRILADSLWRSSCFSNHCFAILKKI
jgi:SAM-dependent methyltransferase